MAGNDAVATIVGNMTREPKLEFTASGQAVCSIGVAVSNRKKEGDEWVDGPGQFFDVTIWGQMGENVAESLPKGARVIVKARLDFRQWEDQEGNKRSKVSFVADSVGPDLKWATCEVFKTERREPGTQSGGSSKADYDPDEKPF